MDFAVPAPFGPAEAGPPAALAGAPTVPFRLLSDAGLRNDRQSVGFNDDACGINAVNLVISLSQFQSA
jgi:hypothetical protein